MSTEQEKTDTKGESTIMQGDEAAKAADFANYFCEYASVYHQQIMLMDHVRMKAYNDAIMLNRSLFEGKVVLDCGSGTGVLAIFAAQAGAKKVYAVEYTEMANHARRMVEQNGVSHIVEVIQSAMEDIKLPCKVDIIVSEWMGYFLFRESMLDSVIRCRDKWLKPGGSMFPSHATLIIGAITNEDERKHRVRSYRRATHDVEHFSDRMQDSYNLDTSTLAENLVKENLDYHVYSSAWSNLTPQDMLGSPCTVKEMDLNTCSLEDVIGVPTTPYSIPITRPPRNQASHCISGVAGWFTADFKGSTENPCPNPVSLDTGPEVPYTHWGQQACYFKEPLRVAPAQDNSQAVMNLSGTFALLRTKQNQRMYKMHLSTQVSPNRSIMQEYEIL